MNQNYVKNIFFYCNYTHSGQSLMLAALNCCFLSVVKNNVGAQFSKILYYTLFKKNKFSIITHKVVIKIEKKNC